MGLSCFSSPFSSTLSYLSKSFFAPKKTYAVETQKLFKIWCSPNPDEFLPKINQQRLEKLRANNPQANISLAYDSRLLNDKAKQALLVFSHRLNISLFDTATQVNLDLLSVRERKLMEIYLDEISHLNEGGNLAAASDIIRLMPFMRPLGIYTDFDVEVNTSTLANIVFLKRPVAFNLHFNGDRTCINNDVLIMSDHPEAHALIEILQQKILTAVEERQPRLYRAGLSPANLVQYTESLIRSVMETTGSRVYMETLEQKYLGLFDLTCFPLQHFSLHVTPFAHCFSSKQLDQGLNSRTSEGGDISYTPYGRQRMNIRAC